MAPPKTREEVSVTNECAVADRTRLPGGRWTCDHCSRPVCTMCWEHECGDTCGHRVADDSESPALLESIVVMLAHDMDCACPECFPEEEPTRAELRAGEERAEMEHRRSEGRVW